jgi:putative transposase
LADFPEKNHANKCSIDFFTVPTAAFNILFVLVVLSHSRRKVVHFNVTSNPTAEWTANQVVGPLQETEIIVR